MIDLHTHTFLSDGVLIPSEHVRRAEEKGYLYLGMSDHVDMSNIDLVVPRLVQAAKELNPHVRIGVLAGAELTHVPPALFGPLTRRARELGAAYVVAHGETPVEPVAKGTNRAAILAGVDILAHPGLIHPDDVRLAAEKGVMLEITTRKGHSLTNGHVARAASEAGALLVLNTDAHEPSDMVTRDFARLVALGAGLAEADFDTMQDNALAFIRRIGCQK